MLLFFRCCSFIVNLEPLNANATWKRSAKHGLAWKGIQCDVAMKLIMTIWLSIEQEEGLGETSLPLWMNTSLASSSLSDSSLSDSSLASLSVETSKIEKRKTMLFTTEGEVNVDWLSVVTGGRQKKSNWSN